MARGDLATRSQLPRLDSLPPSPERGASFNRREEIALLEFANVDFIEGSARDRRRNDAMSAAVHRTARTSLFAASPALVAVIVGLVGFRSSRCWADTRCSVRLSTDTVDAAWADAARGVERRLGHAGGCGIFELRVAGASASLTLVTDDGCHARL